MAKFNILCIDDQREVLATVKKDLEQFSPAFEITECESATEAEDVLNDLLEEGEKIALIICDHIMPGENGIDFFIRLNNDTRLAGTKKMLLTGLATHQDTIRAINEAEIDLYTEKPWEEAEFVSSIRRLLTRYVLESGEDFSDIQSYLDETILARAGK